MFIALSLIFYQVDIIDTNLKYFLNNNKFPIFIKPLLKIY